LASWLDARAHGGQWLVRIEDVDTPRCIAGADRTILQQLTDCGLHPDEPPVWQSQRSALYQWSLDVLATQGLAYPCACSRKDIEMALQHSGASRARNAELIYPGTCRAGLHGRSGRAWRLRTDIHASNMLPAPVEYAQAATNLIAITAPDAGSSVHWSDRRLGPQQQNVALEVGDFVLKRADGCYAYQLAVVVDDAAQGITHVVRGEDLADNTARQILLQRQLHLPTPSYLHTPLVQGPNGEKLSKQNGATALDCATPSAALAALKSAAKVLNLDPLTSRDNIGDALAAWIAQWQALPQRQSPLKDTE
jgi:glutamyl-Q tRNA(Asp) synthetase